MRNSNKVLLIAAAGILALVLAFVLVMGLTARSLFETRGRTVQAHRPRAAYCLPAASSTIDLSLPKTLLAGSSSRASSSIERASS